MTIKKSEALKWALTVVMALATTACIKDEEPNTECDILTVDVPDEILLRSPEIENDKVDIKVKDYVDVTAIAPEFTLTPGATISPESGTVRDFTEPQEYVVTSQDGQWHKTYTISVVKDKFENLRFGFEHVYTEHKFNADYDVFFEVDPEDPSTRTMTWASGNQGFAWTFEGSTPNTFPTFQSENGVVGKCVELITRETGSLGASVKKPIAAGNLFIGRFIMETAITDPRGSTLFGAPFRMVPRYFSGYFKYKPGEKYQRLNKDGVLEAVPGKVDECNVYSVLFEVTPDMQYLNGNNVLSADNPNIIAVAAISEDDRKGADEWKEFHVPFVVREGKSIDPEKLVSGGYSLAIVMSSSIDGDYFSGAVGSHLFVDELEITCNKPGEI